MVNEREDEGDDLKKVFKMFDKDENGLITK